MVKMNHNSNSANNPVVEANSNIPYNIYSQPWWHGLGHNGFSQHVLVENMDSIPASKQLGTVSIGTETSKPEAKGRMDQGAGANKEMQHTVVSQTEGKYLEHVTSAMHPPMREFLPPPTQLELFGHSVACPSYPSTESYYGGVLPPYDPQALVHSYPLGVHHARMALPLEMAEEPVYVNAKQYHGILRRRQLRAKAELERKLIKVRKPYLHESRHLHAMRRARGSGGRFINTKKLNSNSSNTTSQSSCTNTSAVNTSATSTISKDANSSSDYGTKLHMNETQPRQTNPDNSNKTYSNYPQHKGFQLFRYNSFSDNSRMEEGDFSGKPHHTALTIK